MELKDTVEKWCDNISTTILEAKAAIVASDYPTAKAKIAKAANIAKGLVILSEIIQEVQS